MTPSRKPVALVTGSSGLVGSECVELLSAHGWAVHGVDNNLRADFFGPDGDTSWNLARLQATTSFSHHNADIRAGVELDELVADVRPTLIIHAAAQPSHDLAARRPLDDFDVNARGTLNLLEAARRHTPEAPFVFLSTNKVYGDAPNEIPVVELETRYDYREPERANGISEDLRIDASTHSLFGVSKAAADLLVQEYGRYFGMPTACFRCGCITGAHHSGAELHGFLSYLAKAVQSQSHYRIYGYKGKQVRDNIHARDVAAAAIAFAADPRPGAVYNLGGGRDNSVSVLEAIGRLEDALGKQLSWEYVDEARIGDHICYISDITKFRGDYASWGISIGIDEIIDEFAQLLPAAIS